MQSELGEWLTTDDRDNFLSCPVLVESLLEQDRNGGQREEKGFHEEGREGGAALGISVEQKRRVSVENEVLEVLQSKLSFYLLQHLNVNRNDYKPSGQQ